MVVALRTSSRLVKTNQTLDILEGTPGLTVIGDLEVDAERRDNRNAQN